MEYINGLNAFFPATIQMTGSRSADREFIGQSMAHPVIKQYKNWLLLKNLFITPIILASISLCLSKCLFLDTKQLLQKKGFKIENLIL